jgi:hypothetical protein
MNAGSGKNLNWFWKRWFFDDGYPDLAITSVTPKIKSYNVTITSKGEKPVPIHLTITYADKTVEKVQRSIAVWEKGNTSVSLNIPTNQKIAKITLGSTYDPDVNKSDNVYEVK